MLNSYKHPAWVINITMHILNMEDIKLILFESLYRSKKKQQWQRIGEESDLKLDWSSPAQIIKVSFFIKIQTKNTRLYCTVIFITSNEGATWQNKYIWCYTYLFIPLKYNHRQKPTNTQKDIGKLKENFSSPRPLTGAVAAQDSWLDEGSRDWDLVKQAAVVGAGLLPRPGNQHLHSALKRNRTY